LFGIKKKIDGTYLYVPKKRKSHFSFFVGFFSFSQKKNVLHIYMASPLVLNFSANAPSATTPLVESGANFLTNMVQSGNVSNDLELLRCLYGIKYKPDWSERKTTNYTHSITVNMDPSKIGYQNNLSTQMPLLMQVIKEHLHYIKNICIVYEHGSTSNKLHFHILIRLAVSVNSFRCSLQRVFGKTRYSVNARRINPNNGETLKQNCDRIIEYYKKEEHNKKCPLLCTIKR
jgi:hypothetical protein